MVAARFELNQFSDGTVEIILDQLKIVFASSEKSQNVKEKLQLRFLNQQHTSEIIFFENPSREMIGDGWFAKISNLISAKEYLAIKTSDCMPVVLLNRESVVLLHIGWRGLNKGIVLKALELLKPNLAVLGPSARGCCYEIQSDLIEKFGSSAIYREIEGRIYLNLPAMLKESLSGIPIIDSNICTMCDLRYFSHRRKDSGSNITLICAP